MKIILVDAYNTFIIKGQGIFTEMQKLLDSFANRKIILTNADQMEKIKFGLDKVPYEVFSLEHKPDKTDPGFYKKMLEYFALRPQEVIYFEHNEEAVLSARSVGITTWHYDKDKKDLKSLKKFLENNL